MEREVRYEVERLRDGRSFSTRRVVCYQGDQVIASLGASFQVHEEGPDRSVPTAPAYGSAESLQRDSWGYLVDRSWIPTTELGRATALVAVKEELGDDPLLQASALVFLSDDLPTDVPVTGPGTDVVSGSQHHDAAGLERWDRPPRRNGTGVGDATRLDHDVLRR